jgi:hypothetical protein
MTSLLRHVKDKNLHTWLRGYARHLVRRPPPAPRGPRHLLFAFCDHYEPLVGGVPDTTGDARVAVWSDRYPALTAPFRDADGHAPRHSFFFPGEQYRPRWLDALASFTRRGLGEVELHLHHDADTAANLRKDILAYLALFAEHGHLTRDPGGRLRYAFIHGNWCLANGRSDGRWCGVNDEIPLLFETGCYADFTFPAAPDESQPDIVNQIYWPTGDLARRRAYETGEPARVGEVKRDRILMIEGPLALRLRLTRVPLRIENGDITGHAPPTAERVRTWVDQGIHVEGRPEWVFVKIHTHGAPERTAASILGEGGLALHRELTGRYNDGKDWALHYVTAREMFNIAIAAMEGLEGNPGAYRDHLLPPPPAAS